MTREVTMKTGVAFTARLFLLRPALVWSIVVLGTVLVRAGGPKCVAGADYFDPSVTGQPLTWAQGSITYYTDQGDLSPILPNASANSFVANAWSIWSGVPTAALGATNAGQLAEDVNGTNVYVNSDGSITMPADIQSTATGTPIGIVYDYDGSVTDAFLGAGAGGSSQCFFNAVFGGNDNYGSFAMYQHALIVINGQCAQQSSQLNDVEYRLVRVMGGVLGLGWSQANLNVQTNSPAPGSDDYAGFPVMHYTDVWNCVPITVCYPNPYTLSMDDAAAISRLYPVTTQNQSGFPGKQILSATTARIHGSLYFTDTHGNATQAMQGVNVVARWIDPTSGLPSRRYVASSVSGFLFSGNAGNPITGFDDATGDPYAEWGSNSQNAEGFFDLAGLELPGGGTAQYQLTVEALDPHWSAGAGPYSPSPVSPSGAAAPIIVTLSAGNDVEQDILMSGSAQPLPQAASSWTTPASLPSGGDWIATLSGYGDLGYFLLPAQANRTLSIAVTALNESGNATVLKAQPVIGMWAASDPQGTAPPAFTPSAFNEMPTGMTRLDAQVNTTSNFLFGISDMRGDGRPDYRYHAHVLYADTASPSRVSVNGGAVTVQGTGFAQGLTAAIGNSTATQLSISAGQMMLAAPALSDGQQNIMISDPVSGSSTTMTGALIYGAAASDNIVLLGGSNPSTPVGAQAPSAIRVRVLAADGVTPVNGATIGWNGTNGVQLSACGRASSCSVTSDENGGAATWLTPGATGVATVTATLAPGVYTPSKSVSATLVATESASDIGVTTPYLWISQGATVSVPLTARVLSNGSPSGSAQVNFTILNGPGSLSAASAQTNSSGYATVTLSLTQIASTVRISACVAPGNSPCSIFYINTVPLAQQNLQPVAGAGQVSTGQVFQPIVVRVTDSSSPPNPVLAAPITFLTTILRPEGTSGRGGGETNSGDSGMPVILNVTESNATTDVNGLASIVPTGGNFSPPLEVDVLVTAATGASLDEPLQLFPSPTGNSGSSKPVRPVGISRPVQPVR
jgi:hypothetical protein